MRKSKFTEEQIIRALKEVDAGAKVQDVVRRLGVTETTFYRWKSKCGGLEISDAKRLTALEDEKRRLKTMVADLSLDNQALKHLLGKIVRRSPARARRRPLEDARDASCGRS